MEVLVKFICSGIYCPFQRIHFVLALFDLARRRAVTQFCRTTIERTVWPGFDQLSVT